MRRRRSYIRLALALALHAWQRHTWPPLKHSNSLKPTTVTSHFQLLSKVSLTLLLLSWRQVTVSDIVLGLCHSHCGTGLGSCAALPRAPRESRDTAAADQRLFHNLCCCCCCRCWSFLAALADGSHSYFHSAPSHAHRDNYSV